MQEDLPEPWELLQGYQPGGVLCYFGALAYYELTTQQPAFYHIATLEARKPGQVVEVAPRTRESGHEAAERDPLGSLEFRYQDVPCYTTRRDKALVPGVQTREFGPLASGCGSRPLSSRCSIR